MSVVEEVNHSNKRHKEYIASWILETLKTHMLVEGKIIAVWRLTFKAGTDDIRDSAAITIVKSMFQKNIEVHAHDPKGNANFMERVNNTKLQLFNTPLEAVKDADVLVVLTEWPSFASVPPKEALALMKGNAPYVFDTRGIIPHEEYKKLGFILHKFGL